ncbi:MAG: fused MFS/spermidine synthase, partial [Pseudomonadota bacterium]
YHFGKKEVTILGVSLAVLIAIFTVTKVPSFRENIPFVLVYSLLLIPAALLILQRHHLFVPPLLAAILSITIPTFSQNNASTLAVERGFFGVVKITEQDGYRFMIHGNTIHGSQSLSEDTKKPTSTLYYHENSPIGQVFTAWRHKKRIGAVGLGAGTVACNMGSDQEITFFEIDPLVVKFATNPDYFNFLSACAPNAPIILGDGRLTLQQKPEGYFDVLLLDAFSSDAVPAHLLTREAVRSYFTRVSENGVIMLHISNRHVDLGPILGRIAEAEGLVLRRQQYQPKTVGDEPNFTSGTPSDVVVMARNDDDLAPILQDERWSEVTFTPGRPWTDDYTNIIGAMMEKRSQ